jgi:trehalose 6-phosphate phosphatase
LLTGGAVALFLDFDGTLVELASGPEAIEPDGDLGERLTGLCKRMEGRCAIVSGRALSDIERHIGVLGMAAAGSHGSDIRSANGEHIGTRPAGIPHQIDKKLRAFASANDLDYEAKPHGGALHYRRSPEQGPVAHAFAQAMAAEHSWIAQSGKSVVELVANGANKGAAVRAFMKTAPFAGSRPVFIGDDLTDEAGFTAAKEFGGFGILVGVREATAARCQLSGVAAVHEWLEL